MYYRSHKPPYQKYILYAVVVIAAVALVVWGGNSLKTELEETRAAATKPNQSYSSNYSSNQNSSQDNRSSTTSNVKDQPESTKGEVSKNSSSLNPREDSSDSSNNSDDFYTISVYDGKIAVFKNKDKKPVTVLESLVSYFPEEDQVLLKKGIRVASLSEAMQVLEDYQ